MWKFMADTTTHFIRSLERVVDISDGEAEEFFSIFEPLSIEAGSFFVKRGQVCERIGYMESGLIRHYHMHGEEEVTRWMSMENEFVTALGSFILGQPCSHWLQAVTDCRLWVIGKSEWESFYRKDPVYRDLWTRMLEINVVGFEERVYQQLAGDAEERYNYFMERFPGFIEKVPQKYIASMIGIKPESLSRLRARMAGRRIN